MVKLARPAATLTFNIQISNLSILPVGDDSVRYEVLFTFIKVQVEAKVLEINTFFFEMERISFTIITSWFELSLEAEVVNVIFL